jgi:hypothetical protein
MGWCFLISVIGFFIFPPISLIVLVPMFFWALELFGLKRVIDPFFPKERSQTIYAKIHSKKEPKKIMMFAGHNDSPQVFPLTAKYRKHGFQWIMIALILAGIFLLSAFIRIIWSFSIDNLFFPQFKNGFVWIDYIGLIGVLAIIPILYITQIMVSKQKSLGANDNLSGALTALTLARYFRNHRLDNIELWFAAFGSEEAGQRGSTYFVQHHKEELLAKDAYFVNLESIGGANILLFATAETMCIPPIQHQPEVYNLLKDASRKVMIRRQTVRSELTQGYTDAEPFSRYGIKATSMVGLMVDGFPMLWHIESDTPENIHPGCMRDVMEIVIKAVEMRQVNLEHALGSSGSDSEVVYSDYHL